MMRALVWRSSFGREYGQDIWTYDLIHGTWVGEPDWTTVACGPWLPTWQAACDAACAELRKRGES